MRLCKILVVLMMISALPAVDVNELRNRTTSYNLLREGFEVYADAEQSYVNGLDVNLIIGQAPDPFAIPSSLDEETRVKFQRAIEILKEAVVLNPELADAHLFIANSFTYLGNPKEVFHHFQRSIEVDPARDDIVSAYRAYAFEHGKEELVKQLTKHLELIESQFATEDWSKDIPVRPKGDGEESQAEAEKFINEDDIAPLFASFQNAWSLTPDQREKEHIKVFVQLLGIQSDLAEHVDSLSDADKEKLVRVTQFLYAGGTKMGQYKSRIRALAKESIEE